MNVEDKVVVCSRSFSANKELCTELLSRYRQVKFNDKGFSLSGDILHEFIYDATKVIVGLENIDAQMLSNLPNLRVVSKYGVGIDMLDIAAFASKGIRLGWTGGINKRSVSETVVLFALALSRNLCVANNEVKSGVWSQIKGNLLTDKTFGIIGFGHVGRDLSLLLKPFNCKVMIYDKFLKELPSSQCNFKNSSFEDLLSRSDYISLHVPLNSETRNMIDATELKEMKSSAFLINTSRGGVINEGALFNALRSFQIAGAAFDVFDEEPPGSSPLLNLSNFISTPHMAGTAVETILEMGMAAIDGLDRNSIPYQY
ncbi:phosphoglycerate dehydrogenase [Alphaproteobacteria bacterium]|nr:phosphoglycerate dehydrogenase [Alphaproteobacteria bacterium]